MTETSLSPTAAMVAIGDELLSGRTLDANMHYLAGWLAARGVTLREVRVVQDDAAAIIRAVNALRAEVDYVFTSGGIGPTHDDITAEAIAAAFETDITIRDDARAVLEGWYSARQEDVTPARLRMARIPAGAELIRNDVSGAPGFRIGNVFVMAGVPAIFQNMLDHVDPQISRGQVRHAVTVRGEIKESTLADALARLQSEHPDVAIGSYPGKSGQGGPVSIVLRGINRDELADLSRQVAEQMRRQGAQPEVFDGIEGS